MNPSGMTIIFPTVETFKRILLCVAFLKNMKKQILHGGHPGAEEAKDSVACGTLLSHLGPLVPTSRITEPRQLWLPLQPLPLQGFPGLSRKVRRKVVFP